MRPKGWKQQGFSLIELMVVMALIGLTTAVGAVYMSSHDTELRAFVRNVRFDLERAKHESLARKSTVIVELSYDPPSVDCNEDGTVDDLDRCYMVFDDRNGDGEFTIASNEAIKKEEVSRALRLINEEGAGGLAFSFSPTGESRSMSVDIKTAIQVDQDCCSSKCMAVYYPLSVSHVGRISSVNREGGCQGGPEDTCVDCTYCDNCL